MARSKHRQYHTLLIRDETQPAWAIAFGDFDIETVEAERDEYRDHDYKARDLKIITTGPSQVSIDAAVARLNAL